MDRFPATVLAAGLLGWEPARIDGEPVAAYYNLTVNYELRR